ncbi:helix-turn-helix domain-containing protein [Ancylomarina longa]|uniref:HTH cro/C1-type domain-containing protein n=1 Tax=Ancylomarina longa TaxID=2487017 RepID=A0A434AFB0_9BACT|nr:helix-turn-helix domain-containing protein [Ancylomarina longa]RUT73066.1 hypothetical protein DLK05_15155 [Ancylomarina longa]
MNTKKNMSMPIDTNALILKAMNEKRIVYTDLSRLLQVHLSSAHYMLKNPGMQIRRLWSICEVLQVNIFRQIANEIGIDDPIDPAILSRDQEIENLKKEVQDLKKERDLLKEVIGLQGKK